MLRHSVSFVNTLSRFLSHPALHFGAMCPKIPPMTSTAAPKLARDREAHVGKYAELFEKPLPTGSRRGPSRADRTEAAILESAWELLARRPYESITVDDLAEAAGISRASFYRYFESKSAVVQAITARLLETSGPAWIGVIPADGTFRPEDVRQSLIAFFERWQLHGHVFQAMRTIAETDPSVQRFWEESVEQGMAPIVAVLESPEVAPLVLPGPPSVHDLVLMMERMLFGMGVFTMGKDLSAEEIEYQADSAMAVIFRAVFGTTPTT